MVSGLIAGVKYAWVTIVFPSDSISKKSPSFISNFSASLEFISTHESHTAVVKRSGSSCSHELFELRPS